MIGGFVMGVFRWLISAWASMSGWAYIYKGKGVHVCVKIKRVNE